MRVYATLLPRKKKPVRTGATHSHSGDPVPVKMTVSVKTLGKKTRLPHIGQETSRYSKNRVYPWQQEIRSLSPWYSLK